MRGLFLFGGGRESALTQNVQNYCGDGSSCDKIPESRGGRKIKRRVGTSDSFLAFYFFLNPISFRLDAIGKNSLFTVGLLGQRERTLSAPPPLSVSW